MAGLSIFEMQAEIGKYHLGAGKVIHRQGGADENQGGQKRTDVADRVVPQKPLYRKSDKPKDKGNRSSLWEEARGFFPIPSHIKPRTKGYLLWSDWHRKGIAVDLFSNTWRNPANAQYKRQKLFFNILPSQSGRCSG